MSSYPACVFLVTSRLAGYQSIHPDFREAKLAAREPEAQKALLHKWLRPESGDRLIELIQDKPRIVEIAQTPLMLTLLAKLHEERLEVPKSRSSLYDQAITLLLRRGHGATPKKVRDSLSARKILRRLSLNLQASPHEAWSLMDLEVELSLALDKDPDLDSRCRRIWGSPEDFLEDIGGSGHIAHTTVLHSHGAICIDP